jgi:hypothetical protein
MSSSMQASANPLPRSLREPPLTLAEHLQAIEQLRERVNGHIQFMCQVGSLKGTSGEAREKAVIAFHERLAVLERQLSRIHEDLELG